MAIGALVLLGWTLDVEALKGPIPGLITMKANTALAFVLVGTSVWLLGTDAASGWRRPAAYACAALAALIGAASLAQYVFGWNLGIDELLFDDSPGAAMTVDPGRLAPQTALGFVLIGAAVILLDRGSGPRMWAGQILTFAAALMALFAVLGYAYGVPRLSRVGPVSPMALHTALTFLVLSAAVLCARPAGGVLSVLASPGAGGIMARRLLPAAVVGVPALGWLRLEGEQSGLYPAEIGVALFALTLVAILGALILLTARVLDRADEEHRHADALQQQLAAIVDSSGDAILGKTVDGVITSWNSGAERLYGYTADEVIGRSIATLIPPGLQGEQDLILGKVLAGERIEQYDTRRVRKDGAQVHVALTVSPITDSDGRIVGASTIARDITELKRAGEALASAKEEAERANRAKSEFLSRMSHELRTPLNAILGFGQLLEMDELTSKQRQSVEQILKGGRHLLNLINEVLEISRIEAGNVAISIEPVHAGTVLAEAVDLIRPLAAERAIDVVADPSGACDRHLQADNQKLKQVLLNLLSNAVKYNRQGGTVTVSCEEAPGDRFRFRVTDTGVGIPTELLGRLFMPFERLGADNGSVEGTGLGLALSKRLVEAMGGALEVASERGSGTTFTVELALESGPTTAQEAPEETYAAAAADPPHGDSRVLYIEDNASNLSLVEQILARRPGVKLLTAMNGRLGLDLARQHLPDLILLDLHLPGMPGDEVLRHLRTDPRTDDIPVAILSADATKGQVRRVLDAGAHAYLTKPLDVERFLDVVDEALSRTAVATA